MPFSPLSGLKRIDGVVEKVEGWVLVAMLAAMMFVAALQVVLRNVFSSALSWGDGLTRALVLWTGFVGASLAVRQGRYLNIDALSRLLSERVRRWSRGAIYVFALVVCFFLGMAGVGFVRSERMAGTVYSIGVPSWIVELVIPIVFFFLSFRFLLKLLCILAGESLEKQEWER
jgi:TRAP-type C4-dicarboxylate transport system permease small subunit